MSKDPGFENKPRASAYEDSSVSFVAGRACGIALWEYQGRGIGDAVVEDTELFLAAIFALDTIVPITGDL